MESYRELKPGIDTDRTTASRDRIISGILILYFMLKPLYLISSGLPQICDFFLIISFLFLVLFCRVKISVSKNLVGWIKWLLCLCFFQFIMDSIWYYVTSDVKMLLTASYYFFSLVAVLTCFLCYSALGREKFLDAICNGCFMSSLVAGVGLIVGRSNGIRTTGFFNNPNQLGYYSMLLITIVAFFPKRLSRWKNVVIVGIALTANVVSLSKASLLGLFGMAVMYIVFGNRQKGIKRIVIQLLMVFFLLTMVYWLLFSESSFVLQNNTLYSLRNRILSTYLESDSDLMSGRGYGRVAEMGIHYLWGMGEGAYNRFTSLPGLEVHSTYINLFVSYGLLGLAGYTYLFVSALNKRGERLRNLACFSGVLLYFISHNGIRNTILWMLLAALLIYKTTEEYSENVNSVEPVSHTEPEMPSVDVKMKKPVMLTGKVSLDGLVEKKEMTAGIERISLSDLAEKTDTDKNVPVSLADVMLRNDPLSQERREDHE